MTPKMLEVRDSGTFVPVLAVRLDPACEADRYLLGRAGYGTTADEQGRYVLLCRIAGEHNHGAEYDPIEWRNRTLRTAHQFIIDNWDELPSGSVVDVEYILGETVEPKTSEAASG